jgi:hypothetical protein
MGQLGTGRPRIETKVVDAAILTAVALSGSACVQGITTKGEPYKATFIPHWEAFVENFGDWDGDETNLFPLLCKRALESGAKLYVSRVAHWTGSVWEGLKATTTITQATNSITFTAKFVGKGYNDISLKIIPAKSGDTTKVDILETQGRSEVIIKDFPKSPTAVDLITINSQLKFTSVTTLPTLMPIGSGVTAGGLQDKSLIDEDDYNGDRLTETKGWFAFDDITDSMRIFNFDKPTNAVDNALYLYCENRGDVRFFIRPNDNNDYQSILNYRNNAPILFDTWLGMMVAGEIVINNPKKTNQMMTIPAIGDVCGLMCKKDAELGEWYTTAGPNRGVIKNALGVGVLNLGSTANADYADLIYEAQINYVIKDDTQKIMFWGNRSLLKDKSKGLSRNNVADLAMYLKRELPKIVRSVQFEANIPETWNLVYRRIKPVIENVVARLGIVPNENEGWQWQGDQNASKVDDVVYNTITDIEAGIYKARFVYRPVSVIEYLGLEITNTDSKTFATLTT